MEPKQKVVSVRRERTKAGTIKVKRGKGVFDGNGKMKIPGPKKTMKESLTKLGQNKVEKSDLRLEPVPTEYQKFAQVDYIQNQIQRNTLMQFINEVQKIDGLTLNRDKEGCLVIHSGRNRVAKLIPYKKLWSFEKTDGKTIRPKPEDAVRIIREQMNPLTKPPVAEAKTSA